MTATAADWVNSIEGVKPTDQFIALDRRLFEDCVARALATHSPAPTEAGPWVPRIGDPVKVSPDATYAADWARTDLWVAGVAVDDRGRGVNVTVSEQWPVPMRHSRGYLGLTDDFIVARTDGKPDDLMPSTQGGAEG